MQKHYNLGRIRSDAKIFALVLLYQSKFIKYISFQFIKCIIIKSLQSRRYGNIKTFY